MSVGNNAAVIGPSVKLRGELSGTEDLEFHGEIQGSISLIGALVTIGAKGKVVGNVSAKDIVVLGTVEGNIHAEERADLRASSVVTGEIRAPRLVVEPGADLQVVVTHIEPQEQLEEKTAPVAAASEAKDEAETPTLFNANQGASEADAGTANAKPKPVAAPVVKK
jgi:cytoskeletal protein CcmA (bactofilin family)